MSGRAGFTLIEMVIAVAIAALLVSSVYAALVATSRSAEAEAERARGIALRARALSVLKNDLRGRIALKVESSGDGARLVLSTTADGLLPHETKRGIVTVTYLTKEKGLHRSEISALGPVEMLLLAEPVKFEFLEKFAWTSKPLGELEAVRVKVGDPAEEILVR